MNDLLKFITCGSVDDGKSTLIGHLLYDAKLLYADQKEALLLDSKVGSRGGAIDYSLLLDGLLAEREQGITIDVAYRYFTTDNRSFICADTPGHEEYTRNMACGASFADLAIILADAKQGVLTQTRRHARICALMGIRYFVFAVNKMDLIGYDEQRFAEIAAQIGELERELHLENVVIIPVSATEGDNVTKKSANMTWYKGEALLPYLEQVDVTADAAVEQGFYLPVQRVCSVAVGDTVRVLPSGETAEVRSILVADHDAQSAFTGQPVTLQLSREVDVSRGSVLEKDSGLELADAFQAEILWMDDAELTVGKNFLIKLGTRQIPGILSKIEYKIDINTGEHEAAMTLRKNEIALAGLAVTEPIVLAPFAAHRTQGELILIDRITNSTAAA
uniref:sulfate adenylyltransferase subunit 1 n=1 Tax=uncultured Selenomonas sp. TaxID=159275 RepID=UPI0025DBBCEE